jgi:hypothetical protein
LNWHGRMRQKNAQSLVKNKRTSGPGKDGPEVLW